MSLEPVIGLEVHVQLATATKLFCRCPNRFGAPPNSLTCPYCLGHPGTLPVLNTRAVDLAVLLALALDADVAPRSRFDRKSYLYPDLPKGYQVTQAEEPLATGGRLSLTEHRSTVALRRLHLEEDAGKLTHAADGTATLVDFNRAGVPLVEIVSRPEITSPRQAEDFLRTLHRLATWIGVCEGNLEQGHLRCDANVSLRPAGSAELGARTEIKNLNSFRNVARALEAEIERQSALLARGGAVSHATLSFDETSGTTRVTRDKEEARDYRYLAEPDLPPVAVPAERLERLRAVLPELPGARRRRLVRQLGLTPDDASLFTSSRQLADYVERAVTAGPADREETLNLLRGELLHQLHARDASPADAPDPAAVGRLAALVADGTLSQRSVPVVLDEMWEHGEEARAVVDRLDLTQVTDTGAIAEWAAEVVTDNPELAVRFRDGEAKLLGWFVGRVMARSRGRAEPAAVRRALQRALAEAPVAETVDR